MNPRLLSLGLAALALTAAAAQGQAPDPNRVVELPPLMVTDTQNPLPWRYGTAPGLEILTLCPDATTQGFIEQFCHLRQLLELVLPEELQLKQSVPMVHLLSGTEMSDRLKQDVQVEMFQGRGNAKSAADDQPFVGRRAPQPIIHVLPNLRLMDTDAYTIFALLDNDQVRHGELTLTPDYISFLLQKRVAPLPTWFIVGTARLFDGLTFGSKSVEIAPLLWISEAGNQTVRKTPLAAAASLLPLEDLLVAPHPPEGPPEAAETYRSTWVAQATLLARWALDGRSLADRQAYFKFVDQASLAPVTEAQFHDCFGLTYAEVRERLGRYLPAAIEKTMRLRAAEAPAVIDLKLRPATPGESARIKGDWERMETGFVKRTYPALSEKYLDEARRTLRRGYDLGDPDPRLLAAMGLTECDAGDDAAALPYLAAAVQAHVLRPRAYYEFARILYAQARAKAGPKGKLSAAQTTTVVEPLLSAQRQFPPLADASELFADLWFHSDVTPLPSDLAQLNRATVDFPKNFILGYQTALLDAQAGDWPSVRRLVDRGLKSAAAPAVRVRYEQLHDLLPPLPPPPPAVVAPVPSS